MFIFRKGFTLVEILVVIALIAIIAVPGIYAISNFRSNQALALSTEKFAIVLQNAHIFSREAKDEAEWGVRFVDTKNYRLVSRTGGAERIVYSYSLEAPTVFQGAPTSIWFARSSGDLVGGATEYTIVITTPSNMSRQIHVNSLGTIDQT